MWIDDLLDAFTRYKEARKSYRDATDAEPDEMYHAAREANDAFRNYFRKMMREIV